MAAETDMKNLIGALLFYGYMAAAIALILLILGNSWAFKERTGGRNLTASLYYMLAQFSFVMLSNNMLQVLFHSYYEWARARGLAATYGEGVLRDLRLWEWPTTSTLFGDFARDIVAREDVLCWTTHYLGLSMAVMIFMGVEGRRRAIPSLWAFFALGQILPITMALNLFFQAMVLYPFKANQNVKTSSTFALLSAVTIYFAVVAYMPTLKDTPRFMSSILLQRFLLSTPLWLPNVFKRIVPVNKVHSHHIAVYVATLAGIVGTSLRQYWLAREVYSYKQIHDAVSSRNSASFVLECDLFAFYVTLAISAGVLAFRWARSRLVKA